MADEYVVLVKPHPHSMWTVAGRKSMDLNKEGAEDRRTVLTSDTTFAAIAVAKIESVWHKNIHI
ncbi:MAG TPA: hypothetical protein VF974_08360 [Patescibacteria group bacterium]